MNESADSASCRLCAAAAPDAAAERGGEPVHNTILHRSASFVVVPALGPLVPGHVMVMASAHALSLRDSSLAKIAEYERLARGIRASAIYSDAVEVEHGPRSEDHHAGSCIAHTHVHWIPQRLELASALHAALTELRFASVDAAPRDLLAIDAEYVWIRNHECSRVYLVSKLPSQFVRRVVASRTHSDDWDWAAFPKEDMVRETIKIWQAEFQSLSIPTR